MAVQREATLGRVTHPDPLRVGPDDHDLRVLVTDPAADTLQKGDPIFGWEGDERLALYVNHTRGLWELWRLESDGVYRLTMDALGFVRGQDIVPGIISRLVTIDVRRGFDPAQDVMAQNRSLDEANAKRSSEVNEEFAHQLRHALRRDGVL